MTKILGVTSDGKVFPITIDADGHLQIDNLNLGLLASDLNIDANKDLQVDVASITAGNNLIGRVDARDGDKIWAFGKVIGQNLGLASIPSVDYNATGAVVPPGWVYRVTLLTFYYAGALTPFCFVYPLGTPHTCIPFKQDPMVDDEWYPVVTDIILEAGDYLVGRIEEAAINDTFYFRYGGYGFQV